jgi:hypothetical protein
VTPNERATARLVQALIVYGIVAIIGETYTILWLQNRPEG